MADTTTPQTWTTIITFDKEPIENDWVKAVEEKFKEAGITFTEKEREGDRVTWTTSGAVDTAVWKAMLDETSFFVGYHQNQE